LDLAAFEDPKARKCGYCFYRLLRLFYVSVIFYFVPFMSLLVYWIIDMKKTEAKFGGKVGGAHH